MVWVVCAKSLLPWLRSMVKRPFSLKFSKRQDEVSPGQILEPCVLRTHGRAENPFGAQEFASLIELWVAYYSNYLQGKFLGTSKAVAVIVRNEDICNHDCCSGILSTFAMMGCTRSCSQSWLMEHHDTKTGRDTVESVIARDAAAESWLVEHGLFNEVLEVFVKLGGSQIAMALGYKDLVSKCILHRSRPQSTALPVLARRGALLVGDSSLTAKKGSGRSVTIEAFLRQEYTEELRFVFLGNQYPAPQNQGTGVNELIQCLTADQYVYEVIAVSLWGNDFCGNPKRGITAGQIATIVSLVKAKASASVFIVGGYAYKYQLSSTWDGDMASLRRSLRQHGMTVVYPDPKTLDTFRLGDGLHVAAETDNQTRYCRYISTCIRQATTHSLSTSASSSHLRDTQHSEPPPPPPPPLPSWMRPRGNISAPPPPPHLQIASSVQTSSTQTETSEVEDVAGSSAAEATAQVPPEILTDPTSKLRSLLLECWALSSSDEVVQRAAREAAGMLAPGNRFVEVWIENVSVFHSMCLDLHALGVEVHMEELMAPTLASALQIMAAADSALASWADGALPAGQWQHMLQPIFWANMMRFNMFAPLSHRMRWVSLNCEYGVKRKQGGLHYYTHPRLRQVRFYVPFPVAIAWKQHFSASHVNE